VSLFDIAGLVGVVMILGAYLAAQLHRLDPAKPPSLLLNLCGAGLILVSMIGAFNLPAALVEAAWALAALFGLVRLLLRKR
jgi:hypothetical protein